MSRSQDPHQCLEEAARYRERAAATFDNSELRDSYLALARSYERLANALQMRSPSGNTEHIQD